MNTFFEAVTARFIENLKTFRVLSANSGNGSEAVILTDGSVNAKIVYTPDTSRFFLFRGKADQGEDEMTELQSYFFEPSGDAAADMREAASVANEFCETFAGPDVLAPAAVPSASRVTAKKERENDETSAIFFANRIPGVLPECREPLLQHKEHYGMLLPNRFCEEVVNAAVDSLLDDKSRRRDKEAFFAFLDKMYAAGDMDVKSIITMTILNHITGEERMADVESLLSDDLRKSWKAARRFIGKNVKPEKESAYQQLSKKYRSQLMNGQF